MPIKKSLHIAPNNYLRSKWLISASIGLSLLILATSPYAKTSTPLIICPDVAAAEAGDAPDAYFLGKAYDEGYCTVTQNKADADHWYRIAAEKGHMLAAYELGETYFTGDGFPLNYPEAKKWYQVAAEKGHGPSQLRMGFLTAEGHFEGLTTNYDAAIKWFSLAAEQDAGDARFRLGNFYNNYIQPPDHIKGFHWLLKAAEGGHRVAMFDVARMLLDGIGVTKDVPQAISWLEKAAAGDLLQAQMTLAELYADGIDVPKDSRKALMWVLKIVAKPTAPAAYLNKAGDIFFEGWEGVPKNYPTALKYYERAAKKEDPHAKARLAEMYSQGLGVPKDRAKAATYSVP